MGKLKLWLVTWYMTSRWPSDHPSDWRGGRIVSARDYTDAEKKGRPDDFCGGNISAQLLTPTMVDEIYGSLNVTF